jgi:uncharacterized protein (TIGR02284 family)
MALQTVTTMDSETIEKLQDLIQENFDSAKGLSQAAESIENVNTGTTLRRIATDRLAQAAELRKYVEFNREQPEDEGSFGGTMRAKWLKFRSTLNGGDAHVVLIEAERMEDHIRDLYEDVLKKTAGSPVNAVLQRQHRVVKGQHDQVKAMRDAVA